MASVLTSRHASPSSMLEACSLVAPRAADAAPPATMHTAPATARRMPVSLRGLAASMLRAIPISTVNTCRVDRCKGGLEGRAERELLHMAAAAAGRT